MGHRGVRVENIFVTNLLGGTIGEYAASGATVDAAGLEGLDRPAGIAIGAVPEPSAIVLMGLGSAMLFCPRCLRRGNA